MDIGFFRSVSGIFFIGSGNFSGFGNLLRDLKYSNLSINFPYEKVGFSPAKILFLISSSISEQFKSSYHLDREKSIKIKEFSKNFRTKVKCLEIRKFQQQLSLIV